MSSPSASGFLTRSAAEEIERQFVRQQQQLNYLKELVDKLSESLLFVANQIPKVVNQSSDGSGLQVDQQKTLDEILKRLDVLESTTQEASTSGKQSKSASKGQSKTLSLDPELSAN